MTDKIRVGIAGYGNLGKGAELAVRRSDDLELVAIFSRRSVLGTIPVGRAPEYRDRIDVLLLCGGSATDLVEQGPEFVRSFHTVDSFDTHARIPEYFAAMDRAARAAGKVATISVGWDPGLFSLNRLLAEAVLPKGAAYTFWGKGVSQGHSDAIRRIPGVKDAKQYTIPKGDVIARIRAGESPSLTPQEAHLRDCYVVPEEGADRGAIEMAIKTMPNYFAGYETKVTFVSEEEFRAKHSGMPHGGFVLRSGATSDKAQHILEFALRLDSNPEFTGSVLAAYARATFRMARSGFTGACTVFDLPFAWLSAKSPEELRHDLL